MRNSTTGIANSILAEQPIKIGYRAEAPYIEFKYRFIKETDKFTKKSTTAYSKFNPSLFCGFWLNHNSGSHQPLLKRQLTLSLAESCTGGLIASQLIKIDGASSFLEGGIVCYSNKMKTKSLEIPSALIEQYGAVSKQVAERMLKNIINLTKTDVGIAVTGIAGPNGGSKQKPVGTAIAFGEINNPQVVA